MPDIMMCEAPLCPLSRTCYRHADSGTRPSQHQQSYWMRDDSSPVGKDCHNYWRRGVDDGTD